MLIVRLVQDRADGSVVLQENTTRANKISTHAARHAKIAVANGTVNDIACDQPAMDLSTQ